MMNTEYLPCIEIETEPDTLAQLSIIALHGLGADGHNLTSLASDLAVKRPIRWLFPDAPIRPVSLHGGVPMRAWYDIHGLDFGSREDEAGLRAAAQSIERLIQREIDRGISSERIFLCGFSQGGALALYTGLRYARCLAGILALSAYLPVAEQCAAQASAVNRHTPIFMAHGDQDRVVSLAMGKWSRDRLRESGYPVVFHRYAMAHSICAQEIEEMGAWIQRFI